MKKYTQVKTGYTPNNANRYIW